MANFPQVIEIFLTQLASLPHHGGHELVHSFLDPVIAEERELRVLFAQQPDHPALEDLFIGLIDVFETSYSVRRAHPRPTTGTYVGYSFVPGRPCLFPEHVLLPLHPHMRRPQTTSVIVNNMAEFLENWTVFTHGALSRMTDWDNVVVAGGSVLACLCPLYIGVSNLMLNKFYQSNAYADSDIDLFLWGLSAEQAKDKMEAIYDAIQRAVPWTTVCVRKANMITIHTSFPNRPIQIVLCLYRSPAEILAGFDIDAACCLYDGHKVYISPRALVSYIRQSNSIDITRCSPSYEVRLAKYADRGFEIYYPGLNRQYLDYSRLYDSDLSSYPTGLARLLVLELICQIPYHYPKIYRPWPAINNSFATLPDDPQPMDFKPVEKKLSKNNYDGAWIRIPYAPDWDAERVIKLVKDIDSRMNSGFSNPEGDGSQRLHRDAVFCGTMLECLGDFCLACPGPTNDEEREIIAVESTKFIRGPVSFIETNPGHQMISGSFHPIDIDDWATGSYTTFVSDDVASMFIDSQTAYLLDNPYSSYLLDDETGLKEESRIDEESPNHAPMAIDRDLDGDDFSLFGHAEFEVASEGSYYSFGGSDNSE